MCICVHVIVSEKTPGQADAGPEPRGNLRPHDYISCVVFTMSVILVLHRVSLMLPLFTLLVHHCQLPYKALQWFCNMKESSEAPPGGALREAACWLRTNGVNTDGAAAKVVNLTDYQKSTPWHLGEDRSRLTGVPKRSLCQKTPFKKCSDPVSADPIRPFPTLDQALRGHIYIYIYI